MRSGLVTLPEPPTVARGAAVPDRPCLLVTGATGVLGRALLPLLDGSDVVALTHRADLGSPTVRTVRGDLTRPRLGLDDATYGRLVDRTTAVVHAAAVTDFGVGEPGTSALNVEGTRRVLDLAAAAGARVLYVSTAFVARAELTPEARGSSAWSASGSPDAYVSSKRRAEALVAASGLPATVARPSVVIGHSRTGAISRYQGLHWLIRGLLRNQVPIMPVDAATRVDVVPVDVAARALAALVDGGLPGGEFWLTAGSAALPVQDLVDTCVFEAERRGLPADPPRFVTREMVERLFRPVFIEPLPASERRRFDELMAMSALFDGAPVFPSSLGELRGGPPALTREDVAAAVAANVADVAAGLPPARRARDVGPGGVAEAAA
jgi:nucleoside-diphosphate-sugar epimerase